MKIYLYINNRINTTQSSINTNMKYYYLTQNKNRNKIGLSISKKPLTNIKSLSYKKLFNLNDDSNNIDNNNKKDDYPKLFSLKNLKKFFNDKSKYNLYSSIDISSRKFRKNHKLKKQKLSSSLIKQMNEKFKDPIKYKDNNNKKLTKSHSQNNYNLFKNKKIVFKNKDKNNNQKIIKNLKYLIDHHKISHACDASTNTVDIFNNRNFKSIKNNKRPLMIDYFYSEHKKFCYGFDKLKGKNKYKKPYYIVYKY